MPLSFNKNRLEPWSDVAKYVYDILCEERLENKKVVDFGCGKAFLANYMNRNTPPQSLGDARGASNVYYVCL